MMELSDHVNEIINISHLEKKENLKNSEYMLLLLEICTNSRKYQFNFSNRSKNFWDQVVSHRKIGKILKNFKSETLKKYWRELRECPSISKTIEVIKNNEELINNPIYKLHPIIVHVVNFVKSKEKNFEKFLLGKVRSKNSQNDSKIDNQRDIEKKKELVKEIKEEVLFLSQKRNIQQLIPPRANPSPLQNKTQDKTVKDNKEKKEKEEEEEEENINVNIPLDEIINTFHEHFKDKKKDEICQALYRTSGKLTNAYLYLQNPIKYEKFAFIGTDDYIIQNFRDKSYYQELIEVKGEELVREREKFLNIK